MIIPRPIRKGDTLGVTAPSFGVDDPLDAARFSNAKSKLAARGYRVRETPDVYTADETGRSAPAVPGRGWTSSCCFSRTRRSPASSPPKAATISSRCSR